MPPHTYAQSGIVFRTDFSGNPIVIDDSTFLFNGTLGEFSLAVAKLRARKDGREFDPLFRDDETAAQVQELLQNAVELLAAERIRPLRDAWKVADIGAFDDADDVMTVVRDLRSVGLEAQPNHAYFFTTIGNQSATSLAPNLFAPNLFAPNLFAPNLFAPNLFAPNLFAPNLFATESGGAGGCCCRPGIIDETDVPVPPHSAKPISVGAANTELRARENPGDFSTKQPGQHVDLHLIDFDITTAQMPGRGARGYNPADSNRDGWIDPVVGHGTFVQSILERISNVKAVLHKAGNSVGVITDAQLVGALREVERLSDSNKQRVLNLSLAGYTEDDRPTPALADQIKDMANLGWLIVAAAGNSASCRLAYPAALPGVVAVAALNTCGSPAWFSNHGPWVDASALGVDVVGKFPNLTNKQKLKIREVKNVDAAGAEQTSQLETDALSTGRVSWSGTSFATPVVAGRLAAAIERGRTLDEALDEIIRNDNLCKSLHYGTRVE